MRDFFHRFFTNSNWFIGTIAVVFILFMFLWAFIDPEVFAKRMNDFFETIWRIIQLLFVLAITILGLRIIFGYRPWWMGGRRNNGGHH